MTYRFPGMDPYIEAPTLWRDFHHSLAEEIRWRLNSSMDEKYYAGVEVHTTYEEVQVGKRKPMVPDVAVLTPTPRETDSPVWVAPPPATAAPIRRVATVIPTRLRSVRIYTTGTDELVTAIELLSPYNKRGEGLAEYRRKRSSLLTSNVHLVEIDLLRGGQRVGSELQDAPCDDTDYILLVNRGMDVNPDAYSDIWPVSLNEPLPLLPIPLDAPDPDVILDMNAVVRSIYERGRYALRIDYQQPVPPPALRPAMAEWMQKYFATV